MIDWTEEWEFDGDRLLLRSKGGVLVLLDAVTGVIYLDNTLVVVEWMKALPSEIIVIEVEPLEHAFGDEMSLPVAEAYEKVRDLALHFATDHVAGVALPVRPLGGGWSA